MKVEPRAKLRRTMAAKTLAFIHICCACLAGGWANPTAFGAEALATPVAVNRTIPQVTPPKSALEFSANPTALEIFRARVFEEPLVPIGGAPDAAENVDLAKALIGYSQRTSPDDFSALSEFLQQFPNSPWRAALLTSVGLEYYNTAHYSRTFAAWSEAWKLSKDATDAKSKAIADRAAGELAYMYARLGRMTELDALLKSVGDRVFVGPATEKIAGAREGLWNMQNRPEVSFRCGPFALHRIKVSLQRPDVEDQAIFNYASTQKGCSLSEVAELSKKVGLNYQMAFRQQGGAFVVPSVVHWKVGHYAALVRQEGDRYLLQDSTFGNAVWATREALEQEASGYCLIPSDPMPSGWRSVAEAEGRGIWGKGQTSGNDPGPHAPCDPATGESCGGGGGMNSNLSKSRSEMLKRIAQSLRGMAVSRVHLMLVNLNLSDEPVGYSSRVGPEVRLVVRYNHRDAFQPANFTYSNFGAKWTCDWISYITDNPQSVSADVKYYIMGGGTRTFTGFNPGTQSFEFQQYDQTQLTLTAPGVYQMLWPNGRKLIFSQSDGSTGTSRKIFLTDIIDPFGNAATLSYDGNLRLTAITDAIGQVTTIAYAHPTDLYKITRVTDPFGRFATFDYDATNRLSKITDVIGLTSQFTYEGTGDFINSLITPYGTNSFTRGGTGTTRWLETAYPDGSRDRVEYNQTIPVIAASDPVSAALTGMTIYNQNLRYRNTYYWSRNACATAYGDYTKARIYHWLHSEDINATSGILQCTKEALENRVWYDYAGQSAPYQVGNNNRPTHVGRVLDDGSTQLYSYAYDGFGHLINSVDPVGRRLTYIYSTNKIDLLEIRQTRAGNNELLAKFTYNGQHLPVTQMDASGQTLTNTFNARGQILTLTTSKGETYSNTYDANGYLVFADGPLLGTSDSVSLTYDAFGRVRTTTGESGYTLTLDYDALDRLVKITFPDGTFSQATYNRLDPVLVRDRAGRLTTLEYDNLRHLTRRTDPMNRTNLIEWCSCGKPRSLTDALGHTTSWEMDVQGRLVSKQYPDGSQISYQYENAISRLRQVTDEKSQVTQRAYNLDNTVKSIAYANTAVPTPSVLYSYDPNHKRLASMTDGIGTTTYSYRSPGSLGAFGLAAVDGPWANDTVTYLYDELGRTASRAINGVVQTWSRDSLGRVTNTVNSLGSFAVNYAGVSHRVSDVVFPGGQTSHFDYFSNASDHRLQRITHRKADTSLISRFTYAYDVNGNITNWVQEMGSYKETWTAGYDPVDRVSSVLADQAATNLVNIAYTYDAADNRLVEAQNGVPKTSHFNALNQLVSTPASSPTNAYEWDGRHRLAAIARGAARSEFAYDGRNRLRKITELSGNSVVSERRFIWWGSQICEERDANNIVVSRFFKRGEQRGGTNLYYFADHLGSIRELTDGASTIRAEYAYSAFGANRRLEGDLDSTFGFTRLLNHGPSGKLFAVHRVYDPSSARWLSRDPLGEKGGLNLYGYVGQNPLKRVDPLGLEAADFRDADANSCVMGDSAEDLQEQEYLAELDVMERQRRADQEGQDNVGAVVDGFKFVLKAKEVKDFWELLGGAGGVDVIDLIGNGIDVYDAITDPSVENVAGAATSCTLTYLMIFQPEIGIPIKIIHDAATTPLIPPWMMAELKSMANPETPVLYLPDTTSR